MNAEVNPLSQSMTEMFANVQKAVVAPTEIDIGLIDVVAQMREEFEDADNTLAELAASIKELGVLQPVLLRPRPRGRYELVSGERRLRASKLAGLAKIPCYVRPLTEEEKIEAQWAENVNRKNLTNLEEARQLKSWLDELGGDRDKLAAKANKRQPWITSRLNLLELPPQAQRLIDEGLSADATVINNVRQIEKKNPAAAKAVVDQAAAHPGKTDLRKATEALKRDTKAPTKRGKAADSGKSSGPTPSTATPRNRSMEEPGPATVTGGGTVFPTAPLKPHEKAITTFFHAARNSGQDASTIVKSVVASDRELIAKHGETFFDRGAKAEDLSAALIAGLARNEFGSGPVELLNLAAFLQGHAKAEKFEVDEALAKIITAK